MGWLVLTLWHFTWFHDIDIASNLIVLCEYITSLMNLVYAY